MCTTVTAFHRQLSIQWHKPWCTWSGSRSLEFSRWYDELPTVWTEKPKSRPYMWRVTYNSDFGRVKVRIIARIQFWTDFGLQGFFQDQLERRMLSWRLTCSPGWRRRWPPRPVLVDPALEDPPLRATGLSSSTEGAVIDTSPRLELCQWVKSFRLHMSNI